MMRQRFLATLVLLFPLAVACGDDDATPITANPGDGGTSSSSSSSSSGSSGTPDAAPAAKDIVDTAVEAKFTYLAAAVTRAGLVETLKGAGPFTVLAPTDDAFKKTPFDTIEKINAADPATLGQILKFHVIAGRAPSTAVSGLTSSETLATGVGTGKLRIRIATAGTAITIFPTKDLSAGAPADGADPGAKVTTADVAASNGVIHVLDSVLIPPSKDIVGAAAAYPALSSLVTTLSGNPGGDTPSLVDTLKTAGPFTVFAPTNDAFTAASGVVATLTPAQVRTVLLYHVLPTFATSGDVTKATAATNLATAAQGKNLNVVPGAPPKIKDSTDTNANLAITDIVTTNGIVHVVDKVLVPTL